MASDAQRDHLRSLIHYAQIRPMRTVHLSETDMRHRLDHGGSLTMDCSEAVTCLCKWAGLHDPNGHGYDGSGYTGTLLSHLPHYSDPRKARLGALVVFGPGAGDHVCMVLQPSRCYGATAKNAARLRFTTRPKRLGSAARPRSSASPTFRPPAAASVR